jgi:putative membrane protein
MITLIRWRKTVSRGESPDTSAAPLLARISFVQAWLIVLMVFAATAMARGLGM